MKNKTKPSISILGCGWLGLELGTRLSKEEFQVRGSTTSKEKFSILKDRNIAPYLINLPDDITELDQFSSSETLFINFPPKLKFEKDRFQEKIIKLKSFIQTSKIIKLVIFISSTSVYGSQQGIVSEETFPRPNSQSGEMLLWAENEILNLENIKSIIIRPSGLCGPNRNPINFFKDRSIPFPSSPVNFIHRNDIIEFILFLLKNNQEINQFIFNLSFPINMSKKEFYSKLNSNSSALTFTEPLEETSPNKKITSVNLEKVNFKLKWNPLDSLI